MSARDRGPESRLHFTAGKNKSAAEMLANRILTIERPDLAIGGLPHLDADHGGLVLCEPKATKALGKHRYAFPGLLMADPGKYEKEVAVPDEPFALPTSQLFSSLTDVLNEQVHSGADIAVTPTRYVEAGEVATLDAIVQQVSELDRDDVVVALPVTIAWFRHHGVEKLITTIQAIPHPVALIPGFSDSSKVASGYADALDNIRTVLKEAPGTGLWRAHLAGFDVLASGGAFAAIGAGGAVRHLVPAHERRRSPNGPFSTYPMVLHPHLLSFHSADWLVDTYASSPPPRCHCGYCAGRFLDSFPGRTNEVKIQAHAHNTALWNDWLPEFFANTSPEARRQWWGNRCRRAVEAHNVENHRIRAPRRFTPSTLMQRWAT